MVFGYLVLRDGEGGGWLVGWLFKKGLCYYGVFIFGNEILKGGS